MKTINIIQLTDSSTRGFKLYRATETYLIVTTTIFNFHKPHKIIKGQVKKINTTDPIHCPQHFSEVLVTTKVV